MRRLTAVLALLLLGATPTPEQSARDLLSKILAQDFHSVARTFNDTMLTALPPAKLKHLWETQLQPQLGALSAGAATTKRENELTVVTVPTMFEKGPFNFVVAFDPAGKVAGLWFHPAAKPDPSTYTTKTALRLPFEGEWFVFRGGRIPLGHDFVIHREGKTHSGDPKLNESYYCWNAPVKAPADGVVTAAVDGIADNIPGIVMSSTTPSGNHVIIDHGNGELSVLAHLRKGTVVPKVRDRVKQGDVIGRCGNSGNSTEPHLHYHLQNAEGNGLPAVFVNQGVVAKP